MNAFKEYKNELDQIKTKVNDFAKKFDFIEFNI